jgi:hypothetical protein
MTTDPKKNALNREAILKLLTDAGISQFRHSGQLAHRLRRQPAEAGHVGWRRRSPHRLSNTLGLARNPLPTGNVLTK